MNEIYEEKDIKILISQSVWIIINYIDIHFTFLPQFSLFLGYLI